MIFPLVYSSWICEHSLWPFCRANFIILFYAKSVSRMLWTWFNLFYGIVANYLTFTVMLITFHFKVVALSPGGLGRWHFERAQWCMRSWLSAVQHLSYNVSYGSLMFLKLLSKSFIKCEHLQSQNGKVKHQSYAFWALPSPPPFPPFNIPGDGTFAIFVKPRLCIGFCGTFSLWRSHSMWVSADAKTF